MSARPALAIVAGLVVFGSLTSCGGQSVGDDSGCTGDCALSGDFLQVSDVETILAQGIAEAQARNMAASFAVSDRVGNILAVYRMNGAAEQISTDGGRGVSGGLDNISIIPDSLAVIAKAVTAAFLSSEGNAFSTRTASQIVQEYFNPGETGQAGGPLFGVQFSSLPCSDINTRLATSRPSPGPHRSPLGLAADPGALPLYRNGVPLGAVAAIADARYGLDRNVLDRDQDLDELLALAASRGYEAPLDRRADRITVDGKTLRYADARHSDLLSSPATAPAFASLTAADGELLAVSGYTESATVVAGTAFRTPASGIRPALGALGAAGGHVLVDAANTERFPPRAGTDASVLGTAVLSSTEVETLLLEALTIANRARAQIRRPLGSAAQVSIAVVDSFGSVLGLVRTADGPVFGTDVAVQKARTASFFSNAAAASDLQNTPDTQYLGTGETVRIADYVAAVRDFLGRPTALSDGAVAFSDRAGGNLARPYFPDGQPGSPAGPLGRPIQNWSPFSVGLQSDLINSAVLQHVVFALGGGADVSAGACTELPATAAGINRLANGTQTFPGSVPIYRGQQLVGGIGVSGDGVDQDDMISLLAVAATAQRLGTINNAPKALRADQLSPQGTRLRYVQCPQAPFLDSDEQRPCDGH